MTTGANHDNPRISHPRAPLSILVVLLYYCSHGCFFGKGCHHLVLCVQKLHVKQITNFDDEASKALRPGETKDNRGRTSVVIRMESIIADLTTHYGPLSRELVII